MASIQTGIQLADSFTAPLMNIISSVNLAVANIEDMNRALNAGIDTSSIEAARNELAQASAAAAELSESFQGITTPAQSVPQPVQWQTDRMQVFDTTGPERYCQEIQSANMMIGQLADTQNEIARRSAGTDIFSPEAVQDMNQLAGRINLVRSRLQELENHPVGMGTERANSEMEVLRSRISQAVGQQQELNRAVQNMDASAANAAYLRLSNTVRGTEQQIRDNIGAQNDLTQSVERCRAPVRQVESGFKGWQKTIIVANNAIGLVKNTLGRIGVSDMSGAFDRMDTMNRFQKTMTTMTGDANVANVALEQLKENTLGTAYGLDVAGKATQGLTTRGMGIGTAADQVRIWADAVSFYGEGTNEQLSSVVDAIGKMYSKGKVEADQLDRLFDAGIGAAEIYANAVGKSVDTVKDNLSDGKIASAEFIETVSQALDKGVSAGAAKEAGDTWATTFSNMQAAVTRGWVNVIEKTDAALASHGLPSTMEMVAMFGEKVETVLNTVGNSMEQVVGIAMTVGNALGTAGAFISDHWGTIAPIIGGIAAAWLGWNAAIVIYNGIQGIANMLSAISTANAAIHSGATLAEAAATSTATGAQVGLNAAMLACPVTWILVAILALGVAVVALANHFSGAGHVAKTTFGAICGGINVVNKFFENLGMTIANVALGIWEAMKACASNLETAFHNAICNVKVFFFDMLSAAVGVIENICAALNKLPFIEFDYSGISEAADSFAAKSAAAANSKRDYTSVKDAFNKGASTYDAFKKDWAADAYKNGAKFGDAVTKAVKDYFKSKSSAGNEKNGFGDPISTTLAKTSLTDNTKKIADNTKKTADAVAITKEDLKYLRDMAERDYINKFTTAKITVNQTNHNKINSKMDLDGMTEHLRSTIEQQMLASAEGVH